MKYPLQFLEFRTIITVLCEPLWTTINTCSHGFLHVLQRGSDMNSWATLTQAKCSQFVRSSCANASLMLNNAEHMEKGWEKSPKQQSLSKHDQNCSLYLASVQKSKFSKQSAFIGGLTRNLNQDIARAATPRLQNGRILPRDGLRDGLRDEYGWKSQATSERTNPTFKPGCHTLVSNSMAAIVSRGPSIAALCNK